MFLPKDTISVVYILIRFVGSHKCQELSIRHGNTSPLWPQANRFKSWLGVHRTVNISSSLSSYDLYPYPFSLLPLWCAFIFQLILCPCFILVTHASTQSSTQYLPTFYPIFYLPSTLSSILYFCVPFFVPSFSSPLHSSFFPDIIFRPWHLRVAHPVLIVTRVLNKNVGNTRQVIHQEPWKSRSPPSEHASSTGHHSILRHPYPCIPQ